MIHVSFVKSDSWAYAALVFWKVGKFSSPDFLLGWCLGEILFMPRSIFLHVKLFVPFGYLMVS